MAAALNLFGVGDLKSKQPEIEQAILQLRESFPFPKYLESTEDSRRSVAQTVVKHLPAGSTILDFGCGPLDKIAVLQSLGYRCTGYDDLGDYNYRAGNNVEKIFSFAALTGVELRRSVPTEAESYDLVMLNDVIEHLHDSPRELLNDLIILIKPGGYLLITVPNLAQHPQASRSSVGKDQPCPLPFVLLVARPLAGSRERICQGGFGVLGAVSGSTPGRTQELSPYDLSVAGGGAPCLSSGDLPVPRLARFMVAARPEGLRVGAPQEPAPRTTGGRCARDGKAQFVGRRHFSDRGWHGGE